MNPSEANISATALGEQSEGTLCFANAICANFNYGGRTWRLPSTKEIATFNTYSKNLYQSGLMLCDYTSGYSAAMCQEIANCKGSYNNNCYPRYVWTGGIINNSSAYNYYLSKGTWANNTSYYRTYPFSVRCVTNLITNCVAYNSTYTGCTECENAHYAKNGACVSSTPIENCATYSGTVDKCIACQNASYASGGKCIASTTVSNCKTYSGTEDKCTECKGGYTLISSKNKCQLNCADGYTLSGESCVFTCSGSFYQLDGYCWKHLGYATTWNNANNACNNYGYAGRSWGLYDGDSQNWSACCGVAVNLNFGGKVWAARYWSNHDDEWQYQYCYSWSNCHFSYNSTSNESESNAVICATRW